ncbi:MAG: cysteine desulfurase family protein [Alphaproteobacteria bacterium]
MDRVYLDYNASAVIRPEVIAGVGEAMGAPHNASSVHGFGREGRRLVEVARDRVGAMTGCPAAQVIFNSGATEGNNTVLRHFAQSYPEEQILVSGVEHPSVLEGGVAAARITVDADGIVDLAALEALLTARKTSLVSVMFVNNETGVVQPIAEIASLAHRHGALFHCDGVQAAGRIALDMAALEVDFLTLSAHKIGGPQGVGALCLGLCGQTPVLLQGGGQEKSARAGTENVAGIHGFGIAAELAVRDLDAFAANTGALQRRLEAGLADYEHVEIHGVGAARVSNTTLFSLPNVSSETLLMAFDLEGVAVSNGSACSSGRVGASHVLEATGVAEGRALGAIRVSSGWASTPSDIDAFLAAFDKVYGRVKHKLGAE